MSTTVKSLGQLLRKVRLELGLTLEEVKNETSISVATLSRIERAAFSNSGVDVRGDTLESVNAWIKRKSMEGNNGADLSATPDLVSLHLRADKNLDAETAEALAQLFRTAYDSLARANKK